jgi:hypothetical protein
VNDDSPFASFVPSTETPATQEKASAAPAKNKGKRVSTRAGKKAAQAAAPLPNQPAAPVAPKKERKPRVKKARQSQIFKIGIGAAIIALAGLNESDIDVLKQVAAGLVDAPKKQRQRVAAAIAKIFA